MNWNAIAFDWNQVRAFLATAEEGSFSAAARALGQTQPTLSRQITALEEDLGVTLFERGRRSMEITEAGLELLEHVRTMGEAAQRISLAASGQASSIEGKVTITSTEVVATYFLPAVLLRLKEAAPGVTVDIVASSDLRDLKKREADIAIRHARPEQPDLIAKLIAETMAAPYASRGFLQKHGRPQSFEDLARLDFIGFDRNEEIIPFMAEKGLKLTPANFKFNSASGLVDFAMVRAGLGVGFLTADMAELDPELEPALPAFEPIPVPVWLVTHRELHTSRRIRLVYDLIAEELPKLARAFSSGQGAA
jgi:DNA-binding transcriptional LysR family regulator